MAGFFIFLFVVLSLFLVLFVLIQPGKGDMGLGSLGRGSQMLFGGSGGQDFFQKATWFMGAIFMAGALALSIYKTKENESSVMQSYRVPAIQKQVPQEAPQQGLPVKPASLPDVPSTDDKPNVD